jgi:hypothetical protein
VRILAGVDERENSVAGGEARLTGRDHEATISPLAEEANFELRVSEELEPGVYSNFLGVWHTGHEFTLDFAVTQPPQEADEVRVIPCRVVARVKIPPTLVFDIIKTLNDNMTRYEETFGEIRQPEPRPEQEPPSGGELPS